MAAEVSARVHLVAEKLQLKAQEAQRKGSAGAAAALGASVRDLRQAVALLAEQAHLLACRRGESADADDEEAARELQSGLGSVERLLAKKAAEMRAKGNEGAAASLLQASAAAGAGRARLAELQQRVAGLQERWDAVAAAVGSASRARSSSVKSAASATDEEPDEEHPFVRQDAVVAATRRLAALAMLLEACFPDCRTLGDFAAALDARELPQPHEDGGDRLEIAVERSAALEQQVLALQEENSRLAAELKEVKTQHARDSALAEKNAELLRAESAALEESLQKLEQEYNQRREQEISNLQAIYDSQRKANEELEQILSVKDDEIAALKKNAESDGAEIQNLRNDVDTMTRESAQNQEDHRRQLAQLRQQLNDVAANSAVEANVDEESKSSSDISANQPPIEEPPSTEAMNNPNSLPVAADTQPEQLQELHQRVNETQALLEEHQSTILSLQTERKTLQDDIAKLEVSVSEQAQTSSEMQERFMEQVTKLSQEIGDRDVTIDTLSAKLVNELQSMSDVHSSVLAELNESLDSLREEHAASLASHESKDAEIARLKSKAATLDQNSGETEKCLQIVNSELEAFLSFLASGSDKSVIIEQLGKEDWSVDTIYQLSNVVIAQLDDLAAFKTQENEISSQKSKLETEIKATSSVFVENGLAVDSVDPSSDVSVHLDWLRSRVAEIAVTQRELNQEREALKAAGECSKQELAELQTQLTSSTEEKTDLEALVASLQEQIKALKGERTETLARLNNLESQLHSSTKQQESESAAKSDKVESLENELAAVRAEFERYRSRSHTALKKMEKRADLLNGMRKENEKLLAHVTESDVSRQEAQSTLARVSAQLEELSQSHQSIQQEFEQYVEEKTKAIVSLEENMQVMTDEKDAKTSEVKHLKSLLQALEQDKLPMLEAAIQTLQSELDSAKATIKTRDATLAAASSENKELLATIAAHEAEVKKLQSEVLVLEKQTKDQEQANRAGAGRIAAPTPSPPASVKAEALAKERNEALEMEIATLRLARASLEEEASICRAELVALQEKFTVIKAAHADKVFSLEEQCQALQSTLDHQQGDAVSHVANHANPTVNPGAVTQLEQEVDALKRNVGAKDKMIEQLTSEIKRLDRSREELNVEVALLTRKLEQLKEESDASVAIDGLTSTDSSEAITENTDGEDDGAKSKNNVAVMEQSLRHLRNEVKRLQDEVASLHEEKETWEHEVEKSEFEELRQSRKQLQLEKEEALKKQQRKTVVSSFQEEMDIVVKELQTALEEHSHAFRDACAFRDAHRDNSLLEASRTVNKPTNGERRRDYEECLVMTSGVVIKAGARFQLPVVCAKQGWRVVWTFKVKEDDADVSFSLTNSSTSAVIVEPQRVAYLSGTFAVEADDTTLTFEWDNSFSWLNEKTLDYHVSIQEPLSPKQQEVRVQERLLESHAQVLREGLVVLAAEESRREALITALDRLHECEHLRDSKLEMLSAWMDEISNAKNEAQERMEAAKIALGDTIRLLDEVQDDAKKLARVWEEAEAEREDVEMTLKLSGSTQLEELMLQLRELQQELDRRKVRAMSESAVIETIASEDASHPAHMEEAGGDNESAARKLPR